MLGPSANTPRDPGLVGSVAATRLKRQSSTLVLAAVGAMYTPGSGGGGPCAVERASLAVYFAGPCFSCVPVGGMSVKCTSNSEHSCLMFSFEHLSHTDSWKTLESRNVLGTI